MSNPRPTDAPGGPSMLDLVRLSPAPVFPPGGEDLYRQIALLTELEEGKEVLDAACGRGVSTLFLSSNYQVEAAGVDPDEMLIREAEARARASGNEARVSFQASRLDDLPYRDGIFDVTIGEIGLAASVDPAAAVRELVRVTKPLGSVVLVQLIWTGNLDPRRRDILVRHLGARPLIVVEWKQLLRDAGVVDLLVQDWSDTPSPFRPAGGPFPDFAEIFTLREKMRILWRAYRRWGWGGVQGALVREREIHNLLTRERALGLSLIKGTRWLPAEQGGAPAA
jgi:SAM-dependent methyltransferase